MGDLTLRGAMSTLVLGGGSDTLRLGHNGGTTSLAMLLGVGPKGDKGDRGDQGLQGLKGDQGLQGLKGDTGAQGLPGVNAVDNDTAVAGYISTAGASATKTALGAGFAPLSKVAATVSASGTAAVKRHNPVDATAAVRNIALPTGQPEGTEVSVEKVDASVNAVNVTGSIRGVAGSTLPLVLQFESIVLRADSTGSWWPTAGHKTKTSLDATYAAKLEKAAAPLRRGELRFNIRDEGAIGTFDDATAAIAAAIAKAKAAVNSAASFGGIAVVYVPGGTYLSRAFTLPSRIGLVGDGWRSILGLIDNAPAGPFISLETTATERTIVKDIAIYGRKSVQTNVQGGLDYTQGGTLSDWPDSHHLLENVLIVDTTGVGLNVGTLCRAMYASNVVVRRSNGHGFSITGTDNMFIGCTAATVADNSHGYFVNNSNNHFDNCKAFFCGSNTSTSDGFNVPLGRNTFSGCEAQDNGRHGFNFYGGSELNVGTGLLADSNGGSGFKFDDSTGQLRGLSMVGLVALTRTNGRYTQQIGIEFANTPQSSIFIGTARANTVDVSGDPGDCTVLIHTGDGTSVARFLPALSAGARFGGPVSGQTGALSTVSAEVGAAFIHRDDSSAVGTSTLDMRLGFRSADNVPASLTRWAGLRALRTSGFANDVELAFLTTTGAAAVERLRIKNNGRLLLNGQIQLYVQSAATLAVDKALVVQTATTAGRPTAASVGVGGQIYDTTLSMPIWSDGTNWRDAMKNLV